MAGGPGEPLSCLTAFLAGRRAPLAVGGPAFPHGRACPSQTNSWLDPRRRRWVHEQSVVVNLGDGEISALQCEVC